MAFPLLFSPWRLGDVEIPNRIVLSPMTTGFGFERGQPTDELLAYYRARCRQIGMAVVAFGAVLPEGRVEDRVPWMWREESADFMAPLAAAIAANGALPCLQLGHGGRQVGPQVIGGPPTAPSAVPPLAHVAEHPRSLSTEEVEGVVVAFGAAAARAAAAGFRAVEIHGAHGYLIHQFLSAEANRRDDHYGGETVAERSRFGVEVIQAVRSSAPETAIAVRINGSDLTPDGMTPDDAATVAERFAAAGADALVVSAGVYGSVPYTIPLLDDPEGTFLDLAARVRSLVAVPVVGVGRITRPETAEQALATGRCDAVAIGRALLADPEWAVKAATDRKAEIRPCIATVEGCAGMLQHGEAISCSVNPEVGREGRSRPRRAPRSKQVVVIGSGAAGLEAARRAGELGHRVSLLERANRIGGGLALAAATPPLRHLLALIRWYQAQLDIAGVEVEIGFDVGPGELRSRSPDHVVLATGAETAVPIIEGYDRLPTWTLEEAMLGRRATTGSTSLPTAIVVLGAGRRALGLALWLRERDHDVVIISRERPGTDTSGLARRAYRTRLTRAGIDLVVGTVNSISESGVRLADGATVAAGGIIVADPVRPRIPPWAAALDFPVIRVGDCREPRGIGAAIAEARDAADDI